MNEKEARQINKAIGQFKMGSIVIEKELSDWESHGESNRDQLIFFITRLAAYKSELDNVGGSDRW